MADEAPSVRETLERAAAEIERRPEPPTPRLERAEPAAEPAVRDARRADRESDRESAADREPDRESDRESAADRDTDAAPADRPRDQFGRFLKTRDAVEPDAEAPATPSDQAQPQEHEPQPEPAPHAAQPDAASVAPEAWSPAAKVEWPKLPAPVREEIRRLDGEIGKAFRQRAEQISALEPIARVIAPYQQKLALRGIHPASAVEQLFAIQDLLDRDPIAGLGHVARSYGIDLQQFAAAQNATQPPRNPEVQAVVGEVAQIKQALAAQAQAVQQHQLQQIQSEVEAFHADRQAHPYFEAVRAEMADSMQRGKYSTLQDAYDAACWTIPAVRNQILEAQRSVQSTARQKAERDAVERARRAGVSVNGAAPAGNGSAGPSGKGRGVRAELEYQANKLGIQ